MGFLVITKWNASTNRVEKSQWFKERPDADGFAANKPGAFVVNEDRDPASLVCDPVARTAAFDPLPPKPPPPSDEIYDAAFLGRQPLDRVFKAYVLSVNDGTVIPGMTNAALKAAIKAKL